MGHLSRPLLPMRERDDAAMHDRYKHRLDR
jgi:hypothetical protein